MAFRDFLKLYRDAKHYSWEGVAYDAGVTRRALAYWVNGRPPSLRKQLDVLIKLGASLDQIVNVVSPVGELREIGEEITRVILDISCDNRIEVNRKRSLLAQMLVLANKLRLTRYSGVDSAIIPVAGWQSRELSLRRLAELMECAMLELKECGISRVVIVVPPGYDKSLTNTRQWAGCDFACQESPMGPGDAVRIGWKKLSSFGPVALLFLDDFPIPRCLPNMIEAHNKHTSTIIGLLPFKKGDEEIRGFACCDGRKSGTCKVTHLVEKPGVRPLNNLCRRFKRRPLSVFGRYILDPSVRDLLDNIGTNQHTMRIEITDALRELSKRVPVYGYVHEGEVIRVSIQEPRKLEATIGRIRREWSTMC